MNDTTKPASTSKPSARLRPTVRGPIVDVDVIQEIIEASILRNSSHCMIAESIRLAVPNAKAIAVDIQTIRWSDPERGLRYIYLTPRVAQLAVIDFDQGKRPEDFKFRLRNAQVTRIVARDRSKRAKPRHDLALDPALSKLEIAERATQTAQQRSVARKSIVTPQKKSTEDGVEINNSRGGSVDYATGGKAPPLSNLAYRRQFGLRGLTR